MGWCGFTPGLSGRNNKRTFFGNPIRVWRTSMLYWSTQCQLLFYHLPLARSIFSPWLPNSVYLHTFPQLAEIVSSSCGALGSNQITAKEMECTRAYPGSSQIYKTLEGWVTGAAGAVFFFVFLKTEFIEPGTKSRLLIKNLCQHLPDLQVWRRWKDRKKPEIV